MASPVLNASLLCADYIITQVPDTLLLLRVGMLRQLAQVSLKTDK